MEDLKLIVGLGNAEDCYKFTRHNIGFLFIDYLLKEFEKEMKLDKKTNSYISFYKNFIFAKPNSYMNLSGNILVILKNKFKLENKNIFVIHDDIEKKLGNYQITFNQIGSGGHNGIRSIHQKLGKDFNRVKIGIGKSVEQYNNSVANFVLSDFKKDEFSDIEKIFPDIKSNFCF